MEQQTYPVVCECGKTHQVTSGDAGSSLACGCGRTVEVPSLVRLKASVGQSAMSADFEIEVRSLRKELPLETECVLCECRTDHSVLVTVQCERAEVKEAMPFWAQFVSVWALGWLGGLLTIIRRDGTADRVIGKNLSYYLPVRVREDCAPNLRTHDGSQRALFRSDLYARLLDKYPHARIFPPS